MSLDKAKIAYGLFLKGRKSVDGDGVFLYVPPKCKAALHLAQLFKDDGVVHIFVGKGSEIELTKDEGNHFIDFALDAGARVKFVDRAVGKSQTVHATLKRDSYFKSVFLGKNEKIAIDVALLEENSEAELFGLARLGEGASQVQARVEHGAERTRSRQHFKSVLSGKGRFSFDGKIYVKPVAQKTEAYQLNNNLILSDEAVGVSRPNLEIFADDVKASHGATTGKLDEEILFYLRSRGLSLEMAKKWLIDGFCKEILDHA